jgi:hypothetical protein
MKLNTLVVGAAVSLALPALALATPLHGHFSGYANHSGGVPGAYTAGETYVAYATLDNVNPDPWYTWNPAKQYTAVISTTVASAFEAPPMILNVTFATASVQIYEDSTTPANYANTGTFTDGTLLLTGSITGMAGQRPNFPGFNWDVIGSVNFTGGAGLGGLLCNLPMGMNDFIAFQSPPIFPPAGYEEAYNIDWFCEASTSVDESTWGRMKSLYR